MTDEEYSCPRCGSWHNYSKTRTKSLVADEPVICPTCHQEIGLEEDNQQLRACVASQNETIATNRGPLDEVREMGHELGWQRALEVCARIVMERRQNEHGT